MRFCRIVYIFTLSVVIGYSGVESGLSVGMKEADLLLIEGKPQSVASRGSKSIYSWPGLQVTVVDGVVFGITPTIAAHANKDLVDRNSVAQSVEGKHEDSAEGSAIVGHGWNGGAQILDATPPAKDVNEESLPIGETRKSQQSWSFSTIALLVAAVGVLIVFGYLIQCHQRGWDALEVEIESEFGREVDDYAARFGETPSGAAFLENVIGASAARLRDPGQNVSMAAVTTSVWSKALGVSTGTSVVNGLLAGALSFIGEALASIGTNKGKTPSQIESEERIAQVVRRYVQQKKKSSNELIAFCLTGLLVFSAVMACVFVT